MEVLDPVSDRLLDTNFILQRGIRQHVVEVDLLVLGGYPVHPSVPLNKGYRVPVEVVAEYPVAVLEVLALGENVGGD